MHLRVPEHGKGWQALMGTYLPGWRERERRLARVLELSALPGVKDAADEMRRLRKRIGSPHPRDLVQEGMRIALVIDDGSHPTLVSLILPAMLEGLEQGGALAEQC